MAPERDKAGSISAGGEALKSDRNENLSKTPERCKVKYLSQIETKTYHRPPERCKVKHLSQIETKTYHRPPERCQERSRALSGRLSTGELSPRTENSSS